jgi:adenine-specific DNA-methyltransferase
MTTNQNPKFQALVTKLREIFQIDRPELDFGIYRILNARAGEINDYLEKRLAEKVQASLSVGSDAQREQVARELKEKVSQYEADGIDPETVPKVKELRQRLAQYSAGVSEHENAVFSHLLTFFSRYYEQGDFISQRRYKGDTYAIPYAGEEVMLHWANKDQYYTKSGENFSNYSFKMEDGRKVHFRLVAADTAKDNRKDNDKERRFALVAPRTVTRVDEGGDEYEEELVPVEEATDKDGNKELIIRFEYSAHPKGTKQEALVAKAMETVFADASVKARWLALSQRAPTEKNPQRTLLEKHLSNYTTRNTADYFIHKDLGGFLRRELDFYIKNEVMHLDDVQNAGAFADIEKNLRMIQCLRSIALELITFLAQLEDFQKKLWLKKKFVVSSHYCITLDRVPKELYPEIVANERQWAQWASLRITHEVVDLVNSAKPGTVEYLNQNQFLTVDTLLFSQEFKRQLQSLMRDGDLEPMGLLIHGDNFQGLRLLRSRFLEQVKCVLTDPPYNTKARDFHYKDNFRHSSWVSMMYDRALAAKHLLSSDGVFFHHVDENEHQNASFLLDQIFGEANRVADIVWKNSSKNGEGYVSMQHEYIVGAVKNSAANKGNWKERKEGLEEIYKAFDGFRKKHGTDWKAIHQAALDFYNSFPDSNPIKDNLHYSWMDEKGVYFPNDISKPANGYFYDVVHPRTGKPCKKPAGGWRFVESTMLEKLKNNEVHFGDDHTTVPNNKTYLKNTEEQSLSSIKYRDGRVASNLLRNMFGEKDPFKNPKDVDLTARILKALETKDCYVLDYFGGSGSTGHVALELQRVHSPIRYILMEIGEHFDSVLVPRIRKAIYSREWKDGEPNSPHTGITHCFKVLKLESYEDTLNNLQLRRTTAQGDLLNTLPQQAKDDYLMNYMLDVESQGSLLSVNDFRKPFDYTLNIAVDSAGAFEPRKVDLVETFNYLIGLRVKHIDAQPQRGFITVSGALPSGESCLVLWRDCEVLDYEGLSRLCDKLAINPADNEFDVVYINGDHNIPTVLTQTVEEGGATRVLKLRQIEPEFLDRMFSVEDV